MPLPLAPIIAGGTTLAAGGMSLLGQSSAQDDIRKAQQEQQQALLQASAYGRGMLSPYYMQGLGGQYTQNELLGIPQAAGGVNLEQPKTLMDVFNEMGGTRKNASGWNKFLESIKDLPPKEQLAALAKKKGTFQGRSNIRLSNRLAEAYTPYTQQYDVAQTMSEAYGGAPGAEGTAGTPTDTLRQTPGYQFALEEGLKSIGANMNQRGTKDWKTKLRYAQGIADQTYQQTLQNYGGLSQQGMQTAGNLANLAVGQGNALAGMYGNYGENSASLGLAQGQTLADIVRGIGGAGVYAAENWNPNAQQYSSGGASPYSRANDQNTWGYM